ncbi:MAG: cyclase family protein [Clostridia bacterium]|nr:cyclase family protein [Clostridia bacterium]
MKIYDITQELFSCEVFPGDPKPEKKIITTIAENGICNLSTTFLCNHNGTHIDAPFHFFDNGKAIDQISLDKLVGYCYVAEIQGIVTAKDAITILEESNNCKKILIKGDATVSLEAAEVFANAGTELIGNESQTVGPKDSPLAVHRVLLGAETVLLEGIRLSNVPKGRYFLFAAPLNLAGCDGAPCRAILTEI